MSIDSSLNHKINRKTGLKRSAHRRKTIILPLNPDNALLHCIAKDMSIQFIYIGMCR